MAGGQTIVSGMAGRYANALYELAAESKAVDHVAKDLGGFAALLESSADLRRLVESPVFSADEQTRALDAILKKEVPSGGLPLDLEIVVQNVGTAAAIARLFDDGEPLIERAVTVTGPGIRRPSNLLVPIGTPIREVIEHCGGLLPEAKQVVLGGPMMGMAQKDLSVPVTKGTSGILVLTKAQTVVQEEPCIRCGRCVEACPMFLNPSRLAQLARAERTDTLKEFHVLDCFECASCSFSCPSHIPLVQLIRVGKAQVRQKEAR